jgi:hypothetical protein
MYYMKKGLFSTRGISLNADLKTPGKEAEMVILKLKNVSAYFLFYFIFTSLFPITIFVLYELVCSFFTIIEFLKNILRTLLQFLKP